MSDSRIFARTGLGNDLLDNPKGRISGDEMLLMALIDGKTSASGIIKKVPPSVRGNLDGIFARLLSAGIIEETGSASNGNSTGNQKQAVATQATPDDMQASVDAAAKKLGAELEQELARVRAQLDATRVRQKELEVGFHKLRLRISAYTEIMHAKLNKQLKELAGTALSGDMLRASFESVLKDALESLNPLNHAVAEQQQILDKTLRLKVSEKQIEQIQKEREAEATKMAQSHPYYKKLRGLEFFKGFANAELLQFLEIAKLQQAEPGDAVLNEGDVGMPFFIIVSGEVTVYKGSRTLAKLDQGDFFGEFAYLSGEEPYRAARVVADTACEFLMVDPLDIEFAPVQLRLHVVEALLRGQVRRTLVSSKPIDNISDDSAPSELDAP